MTHHEALNYLIKNNYLFSPYSSVNHYNVIYPFGGVRDVMDIVVEKRHGGQSSNPERNC